MFRIFWILLFFTYINNVLALPSHNANKTVVITGGLIGIGANLASSFKKDGWNVWVTSRDPKKYVITKGIKVVKLNLKNETDIKTFIQTVYKKDGRIDVLINNAGYGVLGPIETINIDQITEQFDINFNAPIRMITEVLPIMKNQGNGYIINISSLSGIRAIPGLGIYAATKKALEAMSESLVAEVSPWNIKVVLIEPGTVNNNWINHCTIAAKLNAFPLYKKFTQKLQTTLLSRIITGQPPEEVGELALKIVKNKSPHFRYQSGAQSTNVAKKVLVDPTGDQIRNEMIDFAKVLYN